MDMVTDSYGSCGKPDDVAKAIHALAGRNRPDSNFVTGGNRSETRDRLACNVNGLADRYRYARDSHRIGGVKKNDRIVRGGRGIDFVKHWLVIMYAVGFAKLRFAALSNVVGDSLRDFGERVNFLGAPACDGFFRHTEDNGRGFVLRNRKSTGFAHRKQAAGAVGTHACKDDSDGIGPSVRCTRVEQHIHRRTMAIHWLSLGNPDTVFGTCPDQFHMMIPRSDKSVTHE